MEGLGTLGLAEAIKKHPNSLEELFICDPGRHLTPMELIRLFKVEDSSSPGSNRRSTEALTQGFWNDWLFDVEGKS